MTSVGPPMLISAGHMLGKSSLASQRKETRYVSGIHPWGLGNMDDVCVVDQVVKTARAKDALCAANRETWSMTFSSMMKRESFSDEDSKSEPSFLASFELWHVKRGYRLPTR